MTGGAVRLGRAISLALADAGYDIGLHYNASEGEAERTAGEIRDRGAGCELLQGDLTGGNAPEELAGRFFEAFPEGNLLVNSASGYIRSTIEETQLQDFDFQFSLNLRAPFFLMRSFARQCSRGNIINIIDNKIGFNQYHYAAYLLTKKGLAELTRMAALEMAPAIRVNGVAPGVILPGTILDDDYLEWRKGKIPLGKKGDVDDITGMILSILENGFVNGQIFVVDGGESVNHVGLNAGIYTKES